MGIHEFSPGTRSMFVSPTSLTANNIDFEDVSSFPMKGKVHYVDTNIPVEGAILYVDGQPQSKDGESVKTDDEGYFSIDLPLQPGKVIIDEVKVVCSFSLEDATYAYNNVSKKWELTDADFFGEVAKQNLAAGSSYYYPLEVAAVAYTSNPDLDQPK
jgi:hypothetical protein